MSTIRQRVSRRIHDAVKATPGCEGRLPQECEACRVTNGVIGEMLEAYLQGWASGSGFEEGVPVALTIGDFVLWLDEEEGPWGKALRTPVTMRDKEPF